MVRSNQKTENSFPFFNSKKEIQKSTLKRNTIFACLSIAIIAFVFFTSSQNVTTSSNNSITSSIDIIKSSSAKMNMPHKELSTPTPPISNTKISETTFSQKKKKEIKPVSKKVTPVVNEKPTSPTVTKKRSIFPKTEIVKTTASYSTRPKAITTSNKIVVSKPVIRKNTPTPKIVKTEVVKPVEKKIKKVNATPVAKSTDKKLEVNSSITEDLFPASYFAAKNKAAREGKSLLIKFGAKWCLPCREMEQTTFKNKKVKNFLNEHYEVLSIDVDDFDGFNMKSYYKISALPSMLVFDSEGKFLEKYVNSMSTAKFIEAMVKHQGILKSSSKMFLVDENISTPQPIPTLKTVKEIKPSMSFQNVLAKKKNGNTISSLKGKAKNWRSTAIEFTTEGIHDGLLIVRVSDINTGKILNEKSITVLPKTNSKTITDTTIKHQLDIAHEKKKDKMGNYVIEVFHASSQNTSLIGKTSFLKDGQFVWSK